MITVDPDVFAYDEEQYLSNEVAVVSGDLDRDQTAAVMAAIWRAGRRMARVDESGTEHADDEAAAAAYAEGLVTPNYVSDPRLTEQGVSVYVDCKGEIEDAMAETMRTILVEELEPLGFELRVDVGH